MIRGLRVAVAVALALALAGCKSDEVKSAAHQLSWKP
ncbi:MAG: hypothetical protein H6Q89_5392, partial [Myxococcaceae bacterium]|nr:hypothetical protein [Myxococcaceae bacterium]